MKGSYSAIFQSIIKEKLFAANKERNDLWVVSFEKQFNVVVTPDLYDHWDLGGMMHRCLLWCPKVPRCQRQPGSEDWWGWGWLSVALRTWSRGGSFYWEQCSRAGSVQVHACLWISFMSQWQILLSHTGHSGILVHCTLLSFIHQEAVCLFFPLGPENFVVL